MDDQNCIRHVREGQIPPLLGLFFENSGQEEVFELKPMLISEVLNGMSLSNLLCQPPALS